MDDASKKSAPGENAKLLQRQPQRLHHYAFVVKDQEINRQFFEDILGIPLVATWCEKSHHRLLGREIEFCHTFFAVSDNSALAFFQYADDDAYEQLKCQRADRGQHISFKVDEAAFAEIQQRLESANAKPRIIDHGYCKSIYAQSPDGLTVEFTIDPPNVEKIDSWQRGIAHAELARWMNGDRKTNNDERPDH
jgi:glyoxylase I family protein